MSYCDEHGTSDYCPECNDEAWEKKVEAYENLLSDMYDFSNSLEETCEQYSKGQNTFYIYKGLISRVDKIIKKCEASK